MHDYSYFVGLGVLHIFMVIFFWLWPPCVALADADIIFCPVSFFIYLFLFSAGSYAGNPAPLPWRGTATQFSANVRCGQTAGWMTAPLGTEVDLGPGHIVVDGVTPNCPQKGSAAPLFSALVYCGQGRPSQLPLSFSLWYCKITLRSHCYDRFYVILAVFDILTENIFNVVFCCRKIQNLICYGRHA